MDKEFRDLDHPGSRWVWLLMLDLALVIVSFLFWEGKPSGLRMLLPAGMLQTIGMVGMFCALAGLNILMTWRLIKKWPLRALSMLLLIWSIAGATLLSVAGKAYLLKHWLRGSINWLSQASEWLGANFLHLILLMLITFALVVGLRLAWRKGMVLAGFIRRSLSPRRLALGCVFLLVLLFIVSDQVENPKVLQLQAPQVYQSQLMASEPVTNETTSATSSAIADADSLRQAPADSELTEIAAATVAPDTTPGEQIAEPAAIAVVTTQPPEPITTKSALPKVVTKQATAKAASYQPPKQIAAKLKKQAQDSLAAQVVAWKRELKAVAESIAATDQKIVELTQQQIRELGLNSLGNYAASATAMQGLNQQKDSLEARRRELQTLVRGK